MICIRHLHAAAALFLVAGLAVPAAAFEVQGGFHASEDSYSGFGWAPSDSGGGMPGGLVMGARDSNGDLVAGMDDEDTSVALAPAGPAGMPVVRRPRPTYGLGFCLDCAAPAN